jgi:hypothetical protein
MQRQCSKPLLGIRFEVGLADDFVHRFISVIRRHHSRVSTSSVRRVDTRGTDGAFMEPRGCNRWQSAANAPREKPARTKPRPLRWVATGCRSQRMVRRGSTVRVRQRALQTPCNAAYFCSGRLAETPDCCGYGAAYGAFRSMKRRRNASNLMSWTPAHADPVAARASWRLLSGVARLRLSANQVASAGFAPGCYRSARVRGRRSRVGMTAGTGSLSRSRRTSAIRTSSGHEARIPATEKGCYERVRAQLEVVAPRR